MFQWFRTAFKRAEERVAAKDRELERPPYLAIGLANMLGAIRIIEGFPQPQWSIVRHEMERRFSPEQKDAYWYWAAVEWLDLLRQTLGPAFHLDESPSFLLLTSKSPNDRRALARKSELALTRLRQHFGNAADKRGHGKYVIIRLEDEDSYYRYISAFSREGEQATSGAVFIPRGYGHILLKQSHGEDQILAHELTHCVLAPLPLPSWLNEGLAQLMEMITAGGSRAQPPEIWDEHRRYWTKETIQDFWSGALFNKPESQKLSYSLAQILADILDTDHHERFPAFICHARREDAGQEAAKTHLGMTLGALAEIFLGAGEWEPILREPGRPPPILWWKQTLIDEFLHAGRAADARKVWEKAVAEAPNDAEKGEILNYIAAMAILNEELNAFVPEALELCERAAHLAPENFGIPFTRACLLVSAQRHAEAADALRAIVAQSEEEFSRGIANYYLALAELGLGHRAAAETAFQEACTLAPECSIRFRVDVALHGPPPETEYWMETPEPGMIERA